MKLAPWLALPLVCLLFTVVSGPAAADPPAGVPVEPVIARARLEVDRKVSYDPAWVQLAYPGGDVAEDHGVCTDVVVRSMRAGGVDLQKRIHEDIVAHPTSYPTVKHPDASIDHRRVGPMLAYLKTHATELTKDTAKADEWKPGDVVVWAFAACPRCSPDHVGLVSDRLGPRGLPLVIHNMGPAPSEDDRLDAFTVLGHFRVKR